MTPRDTVVARSAALLVERIERAPLTRSFIEHAALAVDLEVKGREVSAATLEKISALVALRAVEFVMGSPNLPSRGALRDRGTLAGFSSAREVLHVC